MLFKAWRMLEGNVGICWQVNDVVAHFWDSALILRKRDQICEYVVNDIHGMSRSARLP